MKEALIFLAILLVVIVGVRLIQTFSAKRDPLGGYVRPDPSNLIPDRAKREEAARRAQWKEDHPGETPPWEKPPVPKGTNPNTKEGDIHD